MRIDDDFPSQGGGFDPDQEEPGEGEGEDYGEATERIDAQRPGAEDEEVLDEPGYGQREDGSSVF